MCITALNIQETIMIITSQLSAIPIQARARHQQQRKAVKKYQKQSVKGFSVFREIHRVSKNPDPCHFLA